MNLREQATDILKTDDCCVKVKSRYIFSIFLFYKIEKEYEQPFNEH